MPKLGWILITLCLTAAALPTVANAQTSHMPPTVHLDTYTGKPTHSLTFEGAGFIANEAVDLYLLSGLAHLNEVDAAGPLTTAVADDRGDVVGRGVVVPMLPAGDYTLTLVGRTSQGSASVGFNVQGFHPWVVLDSYYIAPHAGVGFTGHDFIPGELGQVFLNSLLSAPVAHIDADFNGDVAAQNAFQLPDVTETNQLIFVGQQSQTQVTATFAAATPPPSSRD